LLEAVGEGREVRDVLQDGDGVRDVVVRHPDPLRRAEYEVVLVGHVANVSGSHLRVRSEEPVAVDRGPGRGRGIGGGGERGTRGEALEQALGARAGGAGSVALGSAARGMIHWNPAGCGVAWWSGRPSGPSSNRPAGSV